MNCYRPIVRICQRIAYALLRKNTLLVYGPVIFRGKVYFKSCFRAPSENCTNKVTDFFIPLVSSSAKCNNMRDVMVSFNEKVSYCKTCSPASGYKKKMYKVISPEMQQYFDGHNIAYEIIPLPNLQCEQVFKNDKPQILSPR